jgi:hypothetical protein
LWFDLTYLRTTLGVDKFTGGLQPSGIMYFNRMSRIVEVHTWIPLIRTMLRSCIWSQCLWCLLSDMVPPLNPAAAEFIPSLALVVFERSSCTDIDELCPIYPEDVPAHVEFSSLAYDTLEHNRPSLDLVALEHSELIPGTLAHIPTPSGLVSQRSSASVPADDDWLARHLDVIADLRRLAAFLPSGSGGVVAQSVSQEDVECVLNCPRRSGRRSCFKASHGNDEELASDGGDLFDAYLKCCPSG